jgi:hypothetical protein
MVVLAPRLNLNLALTLDLTLDLSGMDGPTRNSRYGQHKNSYFMNKITLILAIDVTIFGLNIDSGGSLSRGNICDISRYKLVEVSQMKVSLIPKFINIPTLV